MADNDNRKKPAPKKKRLVRKKPGLISALFAIALVGTLVWLLIQLVAIDILPSTMVLLLAVILLAASLIFILLWWHKARTPLMRTVCVIIAAACAVANFTGADYLLKTDQAFADVTNLTDKITHTTSVVVLKSSGITSDKGLAGKKVGTCSAADSEGTTQAVNQLESQADATIEDYPTVIDMVQALYDGDVAAILFPEGVRGSVHEADGYFEFNVLTDTIDSVTYYTDRDKTTENEPDAVASVTSDPFTIFISGNDTYGSLNEYSRSDVNMLVTIDPKTSVVLITSIPRDAYVKVTCRKNETACTPDTEDKLTHTGLHGVATTESTIEDYLGIEINYTVRVNFSSLVNLVDAMGGIDIEVPEGQEVETFYANGEEGVHAGMNHLDGERALAFARERYAYKDGDNQRIRNQQQVITALIQKVVSPEILVRYPKLMEAIGVAFETNMPADQIKSLLRYEILRRPDWQIVRYAIAGSSDLRLCAELGMNASVTICDENMMHAATKLIDMVLSGKKADEVEQYAQEHSLDSQGSKDTEEQRAQIAENSGVPVYDTYEDYGDQSYDTEYYDYSEEPDDYSDEEQDPSLYTEEDYGYTYE